MKTRKKGSPIPITPKPGASGAPPVPITSQWDVNGTQPVPVTPTPTTETLRHGEKQSRGGRRLKSRKASSSPKPKPRRKLPFTLKQELSHRLRIMSFPEVEGKKTASVQMITSDDYHAVYIVFEDNSSVGFEIEPCFTVQAFAGDIEAVGPGTKKTWPEVRSERRSP
jgi:hypothetical protein